LVILFLDKKQKYTIFILFCLFIPFVLSTRMTLLLSVATLLFFLIREVRWYYSLLFTTIFVFIFLTINKSNDKNIWHTIYVGIGSYDNEYVSGLSDNTGYDLFERKTGVHFNFSLGENYYNHDTINQYKIVAREEVKRIFYESPTMFLRNAIFNTCQLFSGGYVNKGGDWLNYFLVTIGVAFFFTLIFIVKKPSMALLVLMPSVTFTWFYPPIPAYMFGSYIFLVISFYYFFITITEKVTGKKIAS
jgi:hypothetical protein